MSARTTRPSSMAIAWCHVMRMLSRTSVRMYGSTLASCTSVAFVTSVTLHLLRFEIDRFDNLAVLLVVGFQELREPFRRLGDHGHAKRVDFLLHVGRAHRAIDLAIEKR